MDGGAAALLERAFTGARVQQNNNNKQQRRKAGGERGEDGEEDGGQPDGSCSFSSGLVLDGLKIDRFLLQLESELI